jgi:MFS family permease
MVSTPDTDLPKKKWFVGTLSYTTGGLVQLFFWLLCGDFVLSVRDRAIPPVMQILFKNFGASDFLTALIFASIPAGLSLFISPVVAYNSDRLRTSWGRRIPFMIIPVPFVVLTTIGLAFSPQLGKVLSNWLGASSPGPNTSSLLVMAVCWTVFEISCIVTYAVFGALVNDVVPQAVMGRFFGVFRAISLIAGIAFFFGVMSEAKAHFTWIFLAIGALYGVAFTLMCLKVKEGEPPPIDDHLGARPGLLSAVITYFRDGFGNPYYLCFFAATILGALCTSPFNLFSLYYSQSVGMSDGGYGRCIAMSYFISLFLSYPIGMAADRFHPLRLSMAGLALYALIMGAGGFLVHDPFSFGVLMVLHTVVSGSIFTAWASLSQRLLPRARFAEISSAGGIIGSIVGIFFSPLIGEFLDHMHHQYRYTLFIGSGITLMALVAFIILHARFMALGGPKNYIAPE